MAVDLRRVALPRTTLPEAAPEVPPREYEARVAELVRRAGVDRVVVYGDREHAANLQFLCGFDPRFEEALLLLAPEARPTLVVGNEGFGYAEAVARGVDVTLCQSLSLLDQARADAPRLDHVLRDAGFARGERVGVVGWKYLTAAETDEPGRPAFVPAFVVSAVRAVTDEDPVDCTALVMAPADGLRAVNSAAQIAAFEWGAARASAAVLRIVGSTAPGRSELELAGAAGYEGEPLTCHVMLSAGSDAIVGLRSPGARRVGEGDGITTAVGYAGGLCCRAGLVTREPDRDFFETFVAPYYGALAAWYSTIGVGVRGGSVHDAVLAALDGAPFRPMLNPGHLGSYDEWLSSPIRAGSDDVVGSGAVFQCDVIPTPLPPGRALNCEDTVALADGDLRAELERDHPGLWARVTARRAFARAELGLELGDDVLPLSDSVGYLAPFWLDPTLVCTLA
jgi:hypothetical protein